MSITVSGVSKFYGQQKALDDVSFEVGKGEVVGFLGPNGAGKSTMMKIITCFVPPSEGSVQVCGFDIISQSMDVRRSVGYLPESNPLYHDMYVKEYLEFVCGMYALREPKKRVAEMVEVTGLGREQHKYIGQLSKGYKQRVGIAQALIHDPQVLILDEPTSGLDPNQLVGIRELITRLGKEKTVLFSSHIMQEVEAVSDRVLIIDRGKLVADGKVDGVSSVGTKVQRVLVEFESPIEASALRSSGGFHEVSELSSNVYRITSMSSDDLRKDVATWAQKNGHLILSLKLEEERLEDIFQKLTSKKG